mmetsp:Transcript_37662/g.61054  ORF Transcript_37662/g.61054 Transcript_37662/m.61054 type:complete len:112 (+) Transcript_37662:67-402(+)
MTLYYLINTSPHLLCSPPHPLSFHSFLYQPSVKGKKSLLALSYSRLLCPAIPFDRSDRAALLCGTSPSLVSRLVNNLTELFLETNEPSLITLLKESLLSSLSRQISLPSYF